MCGIAGIFSKECEANENQKLVRNMCRLFAYRGPDDEGYCHPDENVCMGMRRLSIIDLENGKQPIMNEDGTIWLVFNGEIYNYKELRTELASKGHIFSTNTDTEVIVHGWEEWGKNCLERLDGMFAFSLWDGRSKTLLLARDSYGIKPLYIARSSRGLLWASEMKSLFLSDMVSRDVCRTSVDLFLILRYLPSPYTLVEGVEKLKPGHCLVCTEEAVQEYYFTKQEERDANSDDLTGQLSSLFGSAVRKQMVSDVPVGLLLSGGVDSALVLSHMRDINFGELHTFTVGFRGEREADEFKEARETAAYFETTHHEIDISFDECKKMEDAIAWHLDEPVTSESVFPMYALSQLAGSIVKVVLTGQGADEPHCGYHRYLLERYSSSYSKIFPRFLRRSLVRFSELLPRNERLKRGARALCKDDMVNRFSTAYFTLNTTEAISLLGSRERYISAAEKWRQIISYWTGMANQYDTLGKMSFLDAHTLLSDDLLMYGDKLTMASSLESRVPYLDNRYASFVFGLPGNAKIRRGIQKYAHKLAAAKRLPRNITTRRKKGFATPFDSWLRGTEADSIRRMVTANNSLVSGLYGNKAVNVMFNKHRSGEKNYRRNLYSFYMLELWYSNNIRGWEYNAQTALRGSQYT